MTVAKYFDEMSYGPAPESDIEARDWLARHASGFGHFINGAFVPSASGKNFDTFEPATGKVLAKLANGGAADVDNAVAAARKAQASWADYFPRWAPSGAGLCIFSIRCADPLASSLG